MPWVSINGGVWKDSDKSGSLVDGKRPGEGLSLKKKNLSKPLMNVPPTGGTSNDGRKRRRGIVA